MTKKMKIFAYRLNHDRNFSLSRLIEKLATFELKDRFIFIGNTEIRLDKIRKDKSLWFLDFIVYRDSTGPSKATTDKPVENFDYNDGERPTEETAILFDPERNLILGQYNHHGPKIKVINDYFNELSLMEDDSLEYPRGHDPYNITNILTNDSYAKLIESGKIKKFTVSVDPKKINEEYYKNEISLEGAITSAKQDRAETLEITISVGRSDNFFDKIPIINKLLRAKDHNDEAVKKLKACYIEEDGYGSSIRTNAIDILADRVFNIYDVQMNRSRRLDTDDRWNKLFQSIRDFESEI